MKVKIENLSKGSIAVDLLRRNMIEIEMENRTIQYVLNMSVKTNHTC